MKLVPLNNKELLFKLILQKFLKNYKESGFNNYPKLYSESLKELKSADKNVLSYTFSVVSSKSFTIMLKGHNFIKINL